MAALVKVGVGRKRQSPIWDYFEYDSVSDKSKCLVVDDDDTPCPVSLKGKNPTNLKVHLKSAHREAHNAYLDRLKDTAPPVPPSPETEANPRSSCPTSIKFTGHFNSKPVIYIQCICRQVHLAIGPVTT